MDQGFRCFRGVFLSLLSVASAFQVCAEISPEEVTSVVSGSIIKTRTGTLYLLYGIEGPSRNTPEASRARELTTTEMLGKTPKTIEEYDIRLGLQYIKVVTQDGLDLSELLLRNGLATWDENAWPELKEFGVLEQEGIKALEVVREAEAARNAQKLANEMALLEDEVRRQEQQRIHDAQEREARKWARMSRDERQVVRASLDARRHELSRKREQVIALYDWIESAGVVLSDASNKLRAFERVYQTIRDFDDPDPETEFTLKKMARREAEAYGTLDKRVVEYERLLMEWQQEYMIYETERQRVEYLDAALPKDVRDEEVLVARGNNYVHNKGKSASIGTGFVVAEETVLTCAHVVSDAVTVEIQDNLGNVLDGSIVYMDVANDWSIIKVKGLKASVIPLSSTEPKVGSQVYCLGFPLGSIMGNVQPIAGMGNIASLSGIEGDSRHYQITVPVNPGNSGSPLLNARGQWIGLVSHKLNDITGLIVSGNVPQGLNFAVKGSLISALLSSRSIELPTGVAAEEDLSLEQSAAKFSSSVVCVISGPF